MRHAKTHTSGHAYIAKLRRATYDYKSRCFVASSATYTNDSVYNVVYTREECSNHTYVYLSQPTGSIVVRVEHGGPKQLHSPSHTPSTVSVTTLGETNYGRMYHCVEA